MTPPAILLVTGSRVLEHSPEHAERAKRIIRLFVEELPAGSRVAAGDASGPDDWAIEAANTGTCPRESRIYGLDGQVIDAGSKWVRTWCKEPDIDAARAAAGSRWPLLRNEAMVREVAEQRDKGARVRVLAIMADWSITQGTAHTCACAKRFELPITRIEELCGR